jgi:hypothetical protein
MTTSHQTSSTISSRLLLIGHVLVSLGTACISLTAIARLSDEGQLPTSARMAAMLWNDPEDEF